MMMKSNLSVIAVILLFTLLTEHPPKIIAQTRIATEETFDSLLIKADTGDTIKSKIDSVVLISEQMNLAKAKCKTKWYTLKRHQKILLRQIKILNTLAAITRNNN
jgi:hypothetical protein